MKDTMTSKELVTYFKNLGFEYRNDDIDDSDGYYTFYGYGSYFVFSTDTNPNEYIHPAINNKFAIEVYENFDKISKIDTFMDIPKSIEQFVYLLYVILHIKEFSTGMITYNYEITEFYPRQLKKYDYFKKIYDDVCNMLPIKHEKYLTQIVKEQSTFNLGK